MDNFQYFQELGKVFKALMFFAPAAFILKFLNWQKTFTWLDWCLLGIGVALTLSGFYVLIK
jgi:hypothetical protein